MWSTGEVIPYDEMELDQPGSVTYFGLYVALGIIKDDTQIYSRYGICEAGEIYIRVDYCSAKAVYAYLLSKQILSSAFAEHITSTALLFLYLYLNQAIL